MHCNDICLLGRLLEKFCHRAQDIRVADPMESVLAQLVSLRHVLVDGIRFNAVGKRLVERGVEKGDTVDGGKLVATCPDDLQG